MIIIKYIRITILVLFLSASNISFAENCNQLALDGFQAKNIVVKLNKSDIDYNLVDIYSQYLNKKINCNEIADLKEKISNYFISADYLRPIITLNIIKDEQLIEIQVKLQNISDVVIVNSNLSTKLIEDYVQKILAQKTTKVKYTLKYLELISRVPGYSLIQELKLDHKTNKLFLLITLSKQNGKINVSVNNYNPHSIGKLSQNISIESYSPLDNNDFYSLQFGTTNRPDRFESIMAFFSKPINAYGTFVSFNASRITSNISYEDPVPVKSGTDLRFGTTLGHYLILEPKQQLIAALNYSVFSLKTYEVDANDVGIPSLYTQFYSAGGGLRYKIDSHNGTSILSGSYNKGIGGIYDDYTGASTPYRLNYNLTSLSASRDQKLNDNFRLIANMTASNVTKYAPFAVSPSLGGREYGRGYGAGTLIGNNLLAASFELSYNKKIEEELLLTNLNLYSFYDIGYIGVKSQGSNITKLSSVGFGTRMKLIYGVDLSSEVAFPLRVNYVIGDLDYTAPVCATFFISKSFKY